MISKHYFNTIENNRLLHHLHDASLSQGCINKNVLLRLQKWFASAPSNPLVFPLCYNLFPCSHTVSPPTWQASSWSYFSLSCHLKSCSHNQSIAVFGTFKIIYILYSIRFSDSWLILNMYVWFFSKGPKLFLRILGKTYYGYLRRSVFLTIQ